MGIDGRIDRGSDKGSDRGKTSEKFSTCIRPAFALHRHDLPCIAQHGHSPFTIHHLRNTPGHWLIDGHYGLDGRYGLSVSCGIRPALPESE